MTQSYILSSRAQLDLKSIKIDSLREWGPELTKAYLRKIETRLSWLAEKPALGRPRDDVRKGFRSYSEGRHIIFYRIGDGSIEIVGIPHQRQDVDRFFG